MWTIHGKSSPLFLATVVLVVFPLVALTACKGKGRAPVKTQKTEQTPTPAQYLQVNFITWNEDYLPTLKKEVPLFEKETGVKVNWQILSEDIVRDKVLIDLASGAGKFDLVLTDVWILPEHIASNYLEPLDSFIAEDSRFNRDNWYLKYLDALSYDGHLYALPTESFGPALVYRKDLFIKYGVKVPTNMSELIAAAKRLTLDTNGDGKIDIYGIASRGKAGEEPAIVVSGFAYAYGGTWFENGAATQEEIRRLKAKPAFDSPAFFNGFKTYTDLLRNYGPPGSKDYTWYELIEDGRKGTAAMILNCGFNVGALDKLEVGMRDKYAAALPVRGPAGFTQEDFAMGYGINRSSSHKKEAWQFLNFITSDIFMQGIVDNYVTSIPIRALVEGEKYRSMHPYKTSDGRYVMEESVKVIDWRYMPHIPEYSVIANLLGTATSEVIAGKKTAHEALHELNAAVLKLMQRSGYY
ncbi:MAG: sugar ABC transporter substrate-binding protein [Pseudomonadota bacterium]